MQKTQPVKAKMEARMVNKIPRMVPSKKKTVAWDPNKGKTGMMREVRKSAVPASKKAGMIRQIKKNRI